MALTFLAAGTGQAFLRLDGRTGQFLLSTADGEPQATDLRDKPIALDLNRGQQGWLKVSRDGTDWVPLKAPNAWVDRPSPDHRDGVSVLAYCAEWPAPQVREFRGNSRAVTSFIEAVSRQAGDIPIGRAPRLMIQGVRPKRFGAGSSVEILFELAPREAWADSAIFDDDDHPMAIAEDPLPPAPKAAASSKWG